MDRFLQLHFLTAYPPSNLNRDDLGRPKTAVMGGATRLRISSQSLKRAWRTSDVFESALKNHIGTRTKEMGVKVYERLREKGAPHKKALEWAGKIAGVFGKPKSLSKKDKDALKGLAEEERNKKELHEVAIEQLAHFSPEERQAVMDLADLIAERGQGPEAAELELLRKQQSGADIALFGRMLAADPAYNVEAAAQVAHAITVHKVAVEDDFFSAVDDLNDGEDDHGAGHLGETEFGSGIFYLYICVNRELLLENLNNDLELTGKTLAALIETAATVAPVGKQNSFASRARASYILCETGDQQPRSLAAAFMEPVTGTRMLGEAVNRLRQTRDAMDRAYGACWAKSSELDVHGGAGTLADIIQCGAE